MFHMTPDLQYKTLTPDPQPMDVHLHRMPHYSLNDRQPEDELQFLSLEERECILFFEETIGSLEEELENEGVGSLARRRTPAEMRRVSYERDHDIIDLVHTTPDPKHTNVMPDFQKLIVPPETHFEMKPQREPFMNSPPELNVTSPALDESHQPPPGSTPTPVPIAPSPTVPLQRRSSLELPQNPVPKHGPPTHAKPTHLPDNISLLLGSREHIPHSIATEAVGVQERRAQMLANLSGSAHPLDGGEPSCVRNLPMRSVSFRQPTPDQSRMEALSKLGLAQRRAQSLMQPKDSSYNRNIRNNSIPSSIPSSVNEPYMDTTNFSVSQSTMDRQDKSAQMLASAEIKHSDFNSYGGKSITLNPSTSLKSDQVPNHNATSPKSSDVQLNSFGGWSRVMNPIGAHRDEPNPASGSYSQSPPSANRISPPNSYGARSRTFREVRTADEDSPTRDVSTFHPTASRPAEQSPSTAQRPPHHSGPLSPTRSGASPPSPTRSRAGPSPTRSVAGPTSPTRSRAGPTPTRSGAGPTSPIRSRAGPTPTRSGAGPTSPIRSRAGPTSPTRSRAGPTPTRSRAGPTSPIRSRAGPTNSTKPRASPSSPEIRRKPTAKPSFRAQGVTVQFSGKGTTDEARRDALRKLGLFRGSP